MLAVIGIGAAIALIVYALLSQAQERAVVRSSLRQLEDYQVENVRDQELLNPITERAVAPVMQGLSAVGRRFTPSGYLENIRQKFSSLGSYGSDDVDRFLAVRVVTIALIPVAIFLIYRFAPIDGLMRLGVIAFVSLALALGPDAMLNRRVADRQWAIRTKLPDILDLLVISVEAGLGFEQALDRTTDAVPGPLAQEFSRMLGEIRAGSSRSEALRALERRCNVPEMRSFVLAILQADTFGVSIGRVLRTQADEMRVKRRQLAQEKAMKAPVKMLVPMVLCIFPSLFIVVLAPAVINIIEAFDRAAVATHLEPSGVSDLANDSDLAEDAVGPPSHSRTWQPTPATFIWLFALAWGLRIGLAPLSDNSLLTHIATGRIIFDTGFPHSDPYLFTPHEPSWVVQSWLGSVIYWSLVKAWGMGALMAFNAALTALLAILIVRLARPADGFVARLGLVILTLGVGASAWAERPLMIGLVLMAVLLIAAQDGLDPRWLVPVMFVWVNSHGSFPLGIVALGLLWAGRRLDGGDGRVEWRCLKWAAVGTAVAALNPYGPKLLLFPISMLQRSDVLRTILEWQAPTYDTIWQKLFLVQIAVAVVVLVRRPTWRLALPFVVFVPASLYSARNILVASLVLTAAMAPCLAGVGDLKANARLSSTPLAWLGAFVMAALCVVTLATPLGKPALDLTSYPVAALAYLDANDLVPPADGSEGRLLAQDFVGNLREYLDGPVRDVFIDDRAEVIGEQASADYINLLGVHPNWRDALDRNDIEVIVWQKDFALAAILAESPDWQIRYSDPQWIVAVRRPPA